MSGALIIAASLGGQLTLDDVPASLTDLGSATTTYGAYLEFQTDGELWGFRDVGSDVDLGSWAQPETFASAAHAVKRVYISGDNTHYVAGSLVNNTYTAISSNRIIGIRYTTSGGSDEITTNIDLYLALDTGGTGEIGPANINFNVGELF